MVPPVCPVGVVGVVGVVCPADVVGPVLPGVAVVSVVVDDLQAGSVGLDWHLEAKRASTFF